MSKTPVLPTEKPSRILVLGDAVTPGLPGTALTGFGRVLLNIFSRLPATVPVDFWAINFGGWGYKAIAEKYPHWTLFPGGHAGWNSPGRLGAFLRLLASGHYTHVFLLMDADAISGACVMEDGTTGSFPAALKKICRAQKIRSLLYYPVDAPLQPPWDIIESVDQAVTFTEYGRATTRKALGRSLLPIQVIPHGIDTHFTPLPAAERAASRAEFRVADGKGGFRPFVKPGDYLILNVNKNEWRKDPLRSLEILAGLRAAGVPAKLVLRMDPTSPNGGVHLERAAAQMGLVLDQDVAHIGPVPEAHLRGLYGAADLYLTTSLGEGWGLGVTEALACGTPVAVPAHTSLREIAEKILADDDPFTPGITLLPLEAGTVFGYDTRLRHRVELAAAVAAIKINAPLDITRGQLSPAILEWLSWDRVAGEFMKLMGINPKAETLKTEMLKSGGEA